jgi:hypothetical protein
MGKAVMITLATILLAGCQTSSLCDGARAIRPTAAEIETMSNETQTQILAHNRMLQAKCGVQP